MCLKFLYFPYMENLYLDKGYDLVGFYLYVFNGLVNFLLKVDVVLISKNSCVVFLSIIKSISSP